MSESSIGEVSALVEQIKSHRFDGYSPARIADEIDLFRSGAGIGSITSAVDALDRVASALTETEQTLRSELGKLGVSWHGAASAAASDAVAEQAGFSGEMATTLGGAARGVFAQGDAFNRTRDKLPSADEVRKAVGGTDLGDELMSLIGFETDHAGQVARAREATQHAVQVLNEYSVDSGGNLGSVDPGAEPRTLAFSVAPRTRSGDAGDAGDAPVPLASGVGPGGTPPPVGTTSAATGAGAIPSPSAAAAGYGAAAGAPPSAAFAADRGAEPPTPPAGLAAPGSDGGYQGHSSSTGTAGVVSSTSAPPAAPGGTTPAGPGTGGSYGNYGGYSNNGYSNYGPAGVQGGSAPGPQAGPAAAGRGRVIGRVSVPSPGAHASAGNVINKAYTPLSPVGSGNGAQGAPLAQGRMSGLAAQPPSGSAAGAVHTARATAGLSAADMGAGAAAIGAGGAAGAMSGEGDRHGRGIGRSAPDAGGSERQMTFGPSPGEEEAEAAERIAIERTDEPNDPR